MNIDRFAQHIEGVHLRLVELYQGATEAQPLSNNLHKASGAASLLPISFKELGAASEVLQVAVKELRQQSEELAVARAAVESERQRYQNLFEFVPDGYLVTDTAGIIREVNRAAAVLLNVSQQFLVGKSVVTFVPQAERQSFRSELNWLHKQANRFNGTSTGEALILRRRHESEIRLQPRHGKPLDVALTVTAVCEPNSKLPVTLRWLLHDITHYKQAEAVLQTSRSDLSHDFPLHAYSKRESIPLNPQVIWQVKQGLVKLSTFCNAGEEVLVGLVGPSMVFGPGLTSLQTLQAIALSEVQLVCFPLTKLTAPHLAQSLLPQVSQRLQQAEALLATSGERRVQDRLHRLLRLLKQEIGQPMAQGTRLSIRLTHEDLASACCTTRVTITRLLSKLQQQGKLAFCPKRHIILKEGNF